MQLRRTIDPAVSKRLDTLASAGSQPTSWEEVRETVEHVLASVEGDLTGSDLKLFAEVRALADYIDQIKGEVAALRPEEISTEQIPSATDELGAVVAATEEATESIMAAAEQIESVAEDLAPDHAAILASATTQIYEACSFQDITGQRISKVVGALISIEVKVSQMIETFGGETGGKPKEARPAEIEADGDRSLLEGPQLPGNANSQDDIDALLASLD